VVGGWVEVSCGPILEFFKGLLVDVFENVEKREQERGSILDSSSLFSIGHRPWLAHVSWAF